jgi:hypothetical protein
MRDRGKILTGVAIFVLAVLFPVWYTAAFGKAGPAPNPVVEPDTKPCVESAEYMRIHHMQILDDWRNRVVRQEGRDWTSSDGRVFRMSLTMTCMDCHHDKAKFCDRCHTYADVKPECFECHNENTRSPGGD